jgi:hypothetical protein
MKPILIFFLSFSLIFSFACDDQASTQATQTDMVLGDQQVDQSIQDLALGDQKVEDLAIIDQSEALDMQVSNRCLGGTTYGFLGHPKLLNLEGTSAKTAPKIAENEDGSFSVTWTSMGPLGNQQLWFQSFDVDQNPRSPLIPLGLMKGGQQQLLKTASGWLVIWLNERSSDFSQSGILIQKINQDFTITQSPFLVTGSFNATQISASWDEGFGGMLVYTTGNQGKDGFYAQAFDQSMLIGQKKLLSGMGAWLPQIKFGIEDWGVSWLDPNHLQDGSDVYFAKVNERAEFVGAIKTIENAKAQAALSLTFGANLFALAWSKKDSALDMNMMTLGKFMIDLKIIDVGGTIALERSFKADQLDMILTDVSLLKPNIFAISWQAKDGNQSVLGLNRVNVSDQVLDEVLWRVEGASASDLVVRGKNSEASAWLTWDMMPQASGQYSDQTGIAYVRLGGCL